MGVVGIAGGGGGETDIDEGEAEAIKDRLDLSVNRRKEVRLKR